MQTKLNIIPICDWCSCPTPLIISGPCSAESEEQVLEIAQELKNTDATIFRAGVWKPRTRPGTFEGNGAKALPWLQKVKEKTEDEFIAMIRLESLVWATYINYGVLILALIFVYDIPFFWVLVFNMFTTLIFFIIRYNWALNNSKKSIENEK